MRREEIELIASCAFQVCHEHGCDDCGSRASSYVDWLEIKLSWLELSARFYRI